jgi:hypothetical protein
VRRRKNDHCASRAAPAANATQDDSRRRLGCTPRHILPMIGAWTAAAPVVRLQQSVRMGMAWPVSQSFHRESFASVRRQHGRFTMTTQITLIGAAAILSVALAAPALAQQAASGPGARP